MEIMVVGWLNRGRVEISFGENKRQVQQEVQAQKVGSDCCC